MWDEAGEWGCLGVSGGWGEGVCRRPVLSDHMHRY